MYVCNWTEDLKGIINYLALAWQNNFFPRILIIRGMTFEFEYLGDFEFKVENNLGSWSGDQELAFDEKKRMSKISCKCTFKLARRRPLTVTRYQHAFIYIKIDFSLLQKLYFLKKSGMGWLENHLTGQSLDFSAHKLFLNSVSRRIEATPRPLHASCLTAQLSKKKISRYSSATFTDSVPFCLASYVRYSLSFIDLQRQLSLKTDKWWLRRRRIHHWSGRKRHETE